MELASLKHLVKLLVILIRCVLSALQLKINAHCDQCNTLHWSQLIEHIFNYILLAVLKVVFSVSDIGLVTGVNIWNDVSDDSMSEQCVTAEDELCCIGKYLPETVLCFEYISTLLDNVLIVL